jgi:hypothetical protein
MRIAVRSAVMSALLAGIALCGQAQTPPAQQPYHSSPRIEQDRPNANRVTPQRNVSPQTQTSDAEPRCDKLSGLEKSECERRDVANDAAPAGVTTSMYEKERRMRVDNEAAEAATTTSEAEADSDTARRPSRSTTPVRPAARDRANPDDDSDDAPKRDEAAQNSAANRREQATESNSDADTLRPPRR